MLILAPLAFAKGTQIWDINIGVLYITAVSSLSVIGILMAGWASNNKYSLLGAMRSGAQIVSYELSAGISVISIVVLTGSLRISDIIASQQDGWWLFKGHIPAIISFIIFIIAVTAETNRAPFDLAEAESELTAGFHTEYSGMKFALFFLAEYVNIFIVCADSGHLVPGRLDAPAYRPLGGVQPGDGLYPILHMVYGQDLFPDLRDHVVSLDLSAIADRPAAEPGVEVFIADQSCESAADDVDCDRRMVFLTRLPREIGGSGKFQKMFLKKYISDVFGADAVPC